MPEYPKVVRDGKPSDALVMQCSDNDFQEAFEAFRLGLGIGKYTPIIEPGSSMHIVEHPETAENVKLLKGVHLFERMVVLDHFDCKKFGIPNAEAEIREHFKYAKLAAEVISRAVPDLAFEYHLLGMEHEIPEPEKIVTAA